MKNTIACVFVAAASVAAADGFQNYNIMAFSPGREAQVAADALEYNARTGGDLVLYSLSLHPEGRPAIEKAERYVASYRTLKEMLAGSNVRLGVLVQSIIGHQARTDKDVEPWMRSVNIKGRQMRFCPDDPGFAKYITDTFTLVAREKPVFILTDDDVRAFSMDAQMFAADFSPKPSIPAISSRCSPRR